MSNSLTFINHWELLPILSNPVRRVYLKYRIIHNYCPFEGVIEHAAKGTFRAINRGVVNDLNHLASYGAKVAFNYCLKEKGKVEKETLVCHIFSDNYYLNVEDEMAKSVFCKEYDIRSIVQNVCSEKEQIIIALFYGLLSNDATQKGLKIKAISEMLGEPIGTIKSILSRARNKIRKVLLSDVNK